MTTNITVLLDDLVVILNPPYLHLSVREPSRRTYERLGPPRFFRGERAKHLTIPFEPLRRGPDAGRFNIHLTYPDGPRWHRVQVAAVAPGDVDAVFRPMAEALKDHYLQVVQPVTIDGLRRAGYEVLLPDDAVRAWIDEHAELRRWKLRVTDAKVERFADRFEVFDVEVMDELREQAETGTIMLYRERDGAMLAVGYRKDGLGSDQPVGWFAMPVDDSFRRIIDRTLPTVLGAPFYERLLDIIRELQAEADIDAIEHALAVARAMRDE